MNLLKTGNKAFVEKQYDVAYKAYQAALISMPDLATTINFNLELLKSRGYVPGPEYGESEAINLEKNIPSALRKLPITVLVISWDVGHNCLGRSYMLAEVIQRICRTTLLVGFQFPKHGNNVWEPVREGRLPVIPVPGSTLPEFFDSIQRIASRLKPDIVVACKPRLPSVGLGLMIRERWGCPLIVDVDDHELSFFENQHEVSHSELASMPFGVASHSIEPYGELWTRLTQSLCKSADEIIVSNIALQEEFGGTLVPHVRDETTFDPSKYSKGSLRLRYSVPIHAKIVLFFGTPRVHKGIDILARAVSQATDPNFRLLVVGTAPDPTVTAKLNQLAPGRIIHLPNQPFSAIPEILAMADVVCLPQDEGHAIAKYQLPAKAIDAVAMGIPLLVSNTPPLLQLVNDEVAELVSPEDMVSVIARFAGDPEKVQQWRNCVRGKFLERYSYAAAAEQMHKLIKRCLDRKMPITGPNTNSLIAASLNVIGVPAVTTEKESQHGVDVVVFWKQNDTGLYGRRHDMVIKYLASRPDVRRIIVFDAPITEHDLFERQRSGAGVNHHRLIYTLTYQKLLGVKDTEKISYNVFVYPPGEFSNDKGKIGNRKHIDEAYIPYVADVLRRERVIANESIFWVYPKNYSAPTLIQHFQPEKVVVDVVDDHRAWPGITKDEKERLTENYREILNLSDMAFVNCRPMLESMKGFCPSIRLVPNGCDERQPRGATNSIPSQSLRSEKKRKTIVFVGNLEKKIDIPLLDKLARRFPEYDIILIGSAHANPEIMDLDNHENIRLLGIVPYAEIGSWLSVADVGIVPHLKTDLTESMNPLKLYVYLTWGVPVVSTDVSGIDTNSGAVRVARDHDDFLRLVADTLATPQVDWQVVESYVNANSWQSRFEVHIDELLDSLNRQQKASEHIPTQFDEDSYFGQCCICGDWQDFVRSNRAIRETYRCQTCHASLREREQAQAILNCYIDLGADTLAELAAVEGFRNLHIYEPGTSGPFRKLFKTLPNYYQSDYYEEADRSKANADLPHQSLEDLSYPDESFDLVVTSDILEHVRKPMVAFAEIFRVLKPSGYHVFTVPMQDPLPSKSLARVDTTSNEADVFILPEHYHGNGKGGRSLVYTDFGRDILDMLAEVGFVAYLCKPASGSAVTKQIYTVVAKRN